MVGRGGVENEAGPSFGIMKKTASLGKQAEGERCK